MTDSAFEMRVERTLNDLFDALNASEAADDLDIELGDGMLTVVFEDGAKLIFNRQEAVKQLWLATPWGASHFRAEEASDRWLEMKTGRELQDEVQDCMRRKLGAGFRL